MFKKFFCFTIIAAMIFSLGACKPQAPVIQPDVTDIYITVDAQGNPITSDNQPSVTLNPAASKLVLDPANPGVIDPNYKPFENKVYNKEVTFNIGWDKATIDMQKDAMGRYVENKFKCKFDVKIMPAEKIVLLAAQDQLPDFFNLTLGTTDYMQLDTASPSYLYHIPRTAVDQYPLLKRYFKIHDYLNAFSDVSSDKQYVGLPFLKSSVKPGLGYQSSTFYRKDWAENVKYNVTIDTVEKSYELMKRFRENDPDGNGFTDTYGFSGFLWSIDYIPWVDTYSWVLETDPTSEFHDMYVPGYVNSRMFPCIQWWNRLLTEKIMPADFNLTGGMPALTANKVGVAYGNSDDYWTWEFLVNRFDSSHKDLYPTLPKINGRNQTVDDVVSEFEPLKLADNLPARFPAMIEAGITAISAKIKNDPDKISRMFDFFEWTITQEGANFFTYGILGTDYKIDSAGMAVRLLSDSTSTPGAMKKIWEVYPSVQIAQLVSYDGSTPLPEKGSMYPEWVLARTKRVQVAKDKYAVLPTIAINNIMTPTKLNHLDAYGSTWFEDKINRIIAQDGGKSIEQGWNDFKFEFFDTKEGRQTVKEVNDIMKTKGLVGQP